MKKITKEEYLTFLEIYQLDKTLYFDYSALDDVKQRCFCTGSSIASSCLLLGEWMFNSLPEFATKEQQKIRSAFNEYLILIGKTR